MDGNVILLVSATEVYLNLRESECLEKSNYQNHDIVVHRVKLSCYSYMTVRRGMCQEDFGIRVGMVARMKCTEVTAPF